MLAPAIRPPSAPDGRSLIRISLSSAHDEPALARLIAAMQRLFADSGGPPGTEAPP